MKTRSLATVIAVTALVAILSAPTAALIPGISKQGLATGSVAPDFTFMDANGKPVTLSQFRGKKVFIFSWSSWCRCRYQLPALEEFYKGRKSDTFEVIAVAADSQGFKWAKPYLDKANASFISVVDPNNELGRKYNFWATENGFLISETGHVLMSRIGFYFSDPEHAEELQRLSAMSVEGEGPSVAAPIEERIAIIEAAGCCNTKTPELLELADLYRLKGRLEDAEATLRRAVLQSPRSSDAHYRLGVVLFQKGNETEGVKQWKKARHIEPTNYIFMRNIQAYETPERFYADILGVTCKKGKQKKCRTCGNP